MSTTLPTHAYIRPETAREHLTKRGIAWDHAAIDASLFAVRKALDAQNGLAVDEAFILLRDQLDAFEEDVDQELASFELPPPPDRHVGYELEESTAVDVVAGQPHQRSTPSP